MLINWFWLILIDFSWFFYDFKLYFSFFILFCFFSGFFGTEKDAHWNFAKICPIFSPWTPIWDHFVRFWIFGFQPRCLAVAFSEIFFHQNRHFLNFFGLELSFLVKNEKNRNYFSWFFLFFSFWARPVIWLLIDFNWCCIEK